MKPNFDVKQKAIIKDKRFPASHSVLLRFNREGVFRDYQPGQHITLSYTIGSEIITRTYSICTSPYLDDHVDLVARHVPDGAMSGFLMEHAKPGMKLKVGKPAGNFTFEPDPEKRRHYIMFAAGSGITPIFSMIRTCLYREPGSKISLIYANQSFERIIFQKELKELSEKFSDRLNLFHIIRQKESIPAGAEFFYTGRLNRLLTKKLVKNLTSESDLEAFYYLCGPEGYMQMIEEAFDSLDVNSEQIYKEHFRIPEKKEQKSIKYNSLQERRVQIQKNGAVKEVNVKPGQSILEAALQNQIDIPHSCQEGMCGTCQSTVLEGEVVMKQNYALRKDEVENNQVLICQGYPVSDGVLIKPGR